MARKCGEDRRLPLASAPGKEARESRERRGNTVVGLHGELRASLAAAAEQDLTSGAGRGAAAEPVGTGSLTFLRLVGSFRHRIKAFRLYTRY